MAAPCNLNCSLITIVFLLLCMVEVFCSDGEFEGLYHLPIEHSFDQGPNIQWSNRGVITIRSISNNLAHFVQGQALSDSETETLKELALNNGIYRIRVPVSLESNTEQQYVTAFIKACSLYESSLTDFILLNADSNGNNLLGVSITSSQTTCSGRQMSNDLTNWNTSVEIKQTVPGPVPDTLSYIQKMEKEKIAKAKGEQADNRSFIAKYWMYIVPVFILMMVASSADQGGGQ